MCGLVVLHYMWVWSRGNRELCVAFVRDRGLVADILVSHVGDVLRPSVR